MKKIYALSFIYIISTMLSISYADSLSYGKILYRINAGGWYMNPLDTDTSTVGWMQDDQYKPCDFVDTIAMGDKTFGVSADTTTITTQATVPASTPKNIFLTERDLGKWELSALEYNFPVTAGQKVEVRLYFSENYYTAVGSRVMDIQIENETVLSNFDIFAEVGKNVGLMKTYVATVGADNNLDIDLKKITQLSMINGIEIIELNNATIQGLFTGKKELSIISAYPNPFNNEVSLDFGSLNPTSVRLFDSYGKEIPAEFGTTGSENIINLENHPKGIYYLQAMSSNYKTETIRLIKD